MARRQATELVTVSTRIGWHEEITTIQSIVLPHHGLTEEMRLNGQVIGFIQRAGRIFVALAGSRIDLAEECAQSLFWDTAAIRLIVESGLSQDEQPSHPAPAILGSRSGAASPTPAQRRGSGSLPFPGRPDRNGE